MNIFSGMVFPRLHVLRGPYTQALPGGDPFLPRRTRGPDLLTGSHGRDPHRIGAFADRTHKRYEPGDLERVGQKDHDDRILSGLTFQAA